MPDQRRKYPQNPIEELPAGAQFCRVPIGSGNLLSVRKNPQALVHIRLYLPPQLSIEFRAVNDQHEFRVQIDTSHIAVEGTHHGNPVIDENGLRVDSMLSITFVYIRAQLPDSGFLIEIIHAAGHIGAGLGRIQNHRNIFSRLFEADQIVIHLVIAGEIRSLDNALLSLRHQLYNGIPDDRRLVVRGGRSRQKNNAVRLHGAFFKVRFFECFRIGRMEALISFMQLLQSVIRTEERPLLLFNAGKFPGILKIVLQVDDGTIFSRIGAVNQNIPVLIPLCQQ